MKIDDILEKHIYNVDFDNVLPCEFNGIHLSIVIKKNNDNKTLIVLPLTKSSNGEGVNKINIGKIENLPDNLKKEDSYAVYNQVRTVNCKRFMALKDDEGNRKDVLVNDEIFNNLISLCINELMENLSLENRMNLYNEKYLKSLMEIIINYAYDIRRLTKEKIDKENKIKEIQTRIYCLLNTNIDYTKYISNSDIDYGIGDIIKESIKSKKGY